MGASAGAIEAWQALFQAMPADTGMAFVLVLHLDPSRTSHIAEILQGSTDNVTIVQAEGTVVLEPDHAYVIAPNSKLHMARGALQVEPLATDEIRGGLVDYLFTSLAEAEGARSVGVVLSGAGHDGAAGLARIREAGGLTIAQDPDTASTTSMPQAAIDAGVVDAALAPADIPAALLRFAQEGSRPESSEPPAEQVHAPRARGLEGILEMLGELADVDFSYYKTGTLERRTRRRMDDLGIEDWDDYAARLADDPDELEALYYDVLIGVTEFFRDPPVWDELAGELPALLADRDAPGARVWVAGCGTGEEAYSLAMLLHEQLPARSHSKIQIYATDLNEHTLAVARRGIYPPEAVENVTEGRRQRYFNHYDGRLQIDRTIRDFVTFAPHNALSDAPFSRMDIVTCRNLLIYLTPQGHDMLLKRLHFALRPGGLLVLGRAETLGRQSRLFDVVSETHNIFRARDVPLREPFDIRSRSSARVRSPLQSPRPATAPGRDGEPGPDRRIERFVLRERTPASVVVTADFEIRHLYGRTQEYLVPPTGESRQDLLSWIRPGFYIRLRSVLMQALETGETVTAEGHIDREGTMKRVQCTVEPLAAAIGAEGLLLVTFHDLGEPTREAVEVAESEEPLVRTLEQELSDARRELQATIEQLESAGEEHHASNEELQSLNEELQSSNEELEASKEELQALNEEMNTINHELEEKNVELREANADLNALFVNTGIPTVFLDRDLRIRRFTSAATDLMHLVASDVGRSIEQVKERFEGGRTFEKAREVLATREKVSEEVTTQAGRIYQRNILPYRLERDEVSGVCITFNDVTEQRLAARASEANRAFAEEIIETVRAPLLVLDTELRVNATNRAFREVFGEIDEVAGKALAEIRDRSWNVPELDEIIRAVLSQGRDVTDFEIDSPNRNILVNASRVRGGDESEGVVVSFEDVTQHREAERQSQRRAEELKEDARRKDEWIAMLGHELRNPVGAIGNAVELLEKGPLPAEQHARTVAILKRQVTHIAGLLDDLLDAARIISGKLEIERRRLDLAEVGEWASDTVRPLAEDKEQALNVSLPPAGTVWVEGDPLRLTEILTNLLGNAIKYTESGGRIDLSIETDADTAVIRIADNGMGIAPELQSEIFDTFTQGPRYLDRADRGLGLGLPLVRSLVALHGGEVTVSSEGEGKGSEFLVVLPLARDNDAELDPALAPNSSEAARGPARRVLVVDDEADVAATLEDLLLAHGHEVLTAGDAEAALEAARRLSPQVALLDLGLPGTDGYELGRRLRAEQPDVRLIAITGYRRNADRLEAAGFDDHLIKPINAQRLFELLG
ncbi:MAG: CheR family methyltransferase [Pseudomonadota bacterium]